MNREEAKARVLSQLKDKDSAIKYALYKKDCSVKKNDSLMNNKNYLFSAYHNLLFTVEALRNSDYEEFLQAKCEHPNQLSKQKLAKVVDSVMTNLIDIDGDKWSRSFHEETVSYVDGKIIFRQVSFDICITNLIFQKVNVTETVRCAFDGNTGHFVNISEAQTFLSACRTAASGMDKTTTYVFFQYDESAETQANNFVWKLNIEKERRDLILEAFENGGLPNYNETPLHRVVSALLTLNWE